MNVCNRISVMIKQRAPIYMVLICVPVTKATQAMETVVQVKRNKKNMLCLVMQEDDSRLLSIISYISDETIFINKIPTFMMQS